MSLLRQGTLMCTSKRHLLGFVRNFAFKSDLSPEALYPQSKPQLFTPTPPPVWHFGHISNENRMNLLFRLDTFIYGSGTREIQRLYSDGNTENYIQQKLRSRWTKCEQSGHQSRSAIPCEFSWMDFWADSSQICHRSEQFILSQLRKQHENYQNECFQLQFKNHINKDGYFVIKSDLTRYQQMNLADALEKVRNIIRRLEKESEVKELSPEKVAEIRRR